MEFIILWTFSQSWALKDMDGKQQTDREMTFAMRGNAKPLGKRLSPGAEMPNHSGNHFRPAQKCQTFREMTFAKRGNAKPFTE
ncbi:hypothetical protein [Segatella salivae]|uniref:hypothetical protein n=1 Tax=Segatella salivae TaxID=228604 RepID=UPI001C5F4B62|nr:hypothetical protein [Segatella salivae]